MKTVRMMLASAVLTALVHAHTTPKLGCTRGPRPMAVPAYFNDHESYTSLFDGTTLTGWASDTKVRSAADGAIVGQYKSPAGTRNPQTFLILQGQQPADFELKLRIKLEGVDADSGIQIPASRPLPRCAQECLQARLVIRDAASMDTSSISTLAVPIQVN